MKTSVLPTNDLAFGAYPQRSDSHRASWSLSWPSLVKQSHGVPSSFLAKLGRDRVWVALLSDDELLEQISATGAQLRSTGMIEHQCAIALALASEVMLRSIGLSPYESQLQTAYHLLKGRLVEMQTGEGKTLSAALAAAVAASAGSSVYVLTANDYLVERDYQFLTPFYEAMGFTADRILSTTEPVARKSAWRHPIVYSSARELAFDYLRDHLRSGGNRDPLTGRALALTANAVDGADGQVSDIESLIPGLCFCIVDEADSLLLDEATTPLVVAGAAGALDVSSYETAFALSGSLTREKHFTVSYKDKRVHLTALGVQLIQTACANKQGDLALKRRALELVETALCARLVFSKDRDYAVVNDAIVHIDEQTGRIAMGRQWQGALQAMVQIKEGLVPTAPSRTSAQITYQDFFPRFLHLCGMSGTLSDARHELRSMYRLRVTQVSVRCPSQLKDLGTTVFSRESDKWAAVVEAIRSQQKRGRPVLVGNASVQDSQHLSDLLRAGGVQHQVLNATQNSREARSLMRAGRAGVVTVTTNMAGRGTDIKLSEIARRNGGLHVIATMRNRSRRIDRQLFGRAGRQGDPGSHQCVLSFEDPLARQTWPELARRVATRLFDAVHGRAPALWGSLFSLSQRIEQKRDYMTRAALRAANRGRHRQFGFVGRPE